MVQSWTNADGLTQIFGPDKATPKKAGEYVTPGAMREVELVLTLSALTESEVVQDNTVFIPAGVRIHEVEVITETAGATGTAFDLGLIKTDRTTEIDYDGLLAACPIANHNSDGERTIFTAITTVPASATGTGAKIGTTTAYKGYITASRTDSTAYTAGKLRIKIRFYKP
jgi:hypothetical protein